MSRGGGGGVGGRGPIEKVQKGGVGGGVRGVVQNRNNKNNTYTVANSHITLHPVFDNDLFLAFVAVNWL